MTGRLSKQQVEQYQELGYVLYKEPVLPPAKFAAFKDHVDYLLEKWNSGSGPKPSELMDSIHFVDTKIFEWIFADEILDLVESVAGPDIGLMACALLSKPPGVGGRVPWHEDSAYWAGILDPMDVVTIWLAIDPSMTENGCMRLIPGSHRNGYSDYVEVENKDKHVLHQEIRQDQVDESAAVDLVLNPNECSVHDVKIIHGSNPNTGGIRRCGCILRFFPTTCKFHPDKSEYFRENNWQLYLARGRDRAGNTYADPTKVNQGYIDAQPALAAALL